MLKKIRRYRINHDNLRHVLLFFTVLLMFNVLLSQLITSAFAKETDTAYYIRVHYKFDELNYNGVANEVIDNMGNTSGRAVNGASTHPDGKKGRCAYFNNRSYIELASNVIVSNKFSLSTWIKFNENSTGIRPIFTQSATEGLLVQGMDKQMGYPKFMLYLNGCNHELNLFMRGLSDKGRDFTIMTLNATRWYNIIISFDSSKVYVYVDKGLKLSANHGSDGDFQDYIEIRTIGGHPSEGYFDGYIDEFYVFDNYLLTSDDITALYTLEDFEIPKPAEEEGEDSGQARGDKNETAANQTSTNQTTVNMTGMPLNPFEWFPWLVDQLGVRLAFIITGTNVGAAITTALVALGYSFYRKPILFVNNIKKYGDVCLGRLVGCTEPQIKELSSYWEYIIRDETEKGKKKRRFTYYYSPHNFEEMRRNKWKTLNWGVKRDEYYPHYHVMEKSLPPSLQYSVSTMKDTRGNQILHSLYRFFCFFSMRIALMFYNNIDFDETKKVKKEKIKILQCEYLMERKHIEYTVIFERREYFKEADARAWVRYPDMQLISVIEDEKEYSVSRFNHVNPKVNQWFEERHALETTTMEQRETLPLKDLEFLEEKIKYLDSKIQPKLNELKLPLAAYVKFSIINTLLKEKREIQEEHVKNKIMREEDKYLFRTLLEIGDMKKDPEFRKVQKVGDPIPKIRKIEDLNQGIKEAADRLELLSQMQLSNQATARERDEYYEKYITTAKKNVEILSKMEELTFTNLEKVVAYFEGRADSIPDAVMKVLGMKDGLGIDTKTAVKAQLLGQVEKEGLLKLEQFKKEAEVLRKELDEERSKKKKDKVEISLSDDRSKKNITSLEDMRKFKEGQTETEA